MVQHIDLNCDMGEGFGNYAMQNDALLMQYISSANIACGLHAGNWNTMQQSVALALKCNVAIGAHPGFPDIQGFGRREMKISLLEAYQIVLYQIGALHAFVKSAGGQLHHVKPHGALYNMAAVDKDLAIAIATAVKDFDATLIFYGLSGSIMIKAAENIGLRTASEAFADRTYCDDGTLTPRSLSNAIITNDKDSLQQALMLASQQQIVTTSGTAISLKVDSICLHGDNEHALSFAKQIHEALIKENITIKAAE